MPSLVLTNSTTPLGGRAYDTRCLAAMAWKLDADSTDRMGVTKVGVYEPMVKKQMSFQGVWLADVLKVAGLERAACT